MVPNVKMIDQFNKKNRLKNIEKCCFYDDFSVVIIKISIFLTEFGVR